MIDKEQFITNRTTAEAMAHAAEGIVSDLSFSFRCHAKGDGYSVMCVESGYGPDGEDVYVTHFETREELWSFVRSELWIRTRDELKELGEAVV